MGDSVGMGVGLPVGRGVGLGVGDGVGASVATHALRPALGLPPGHVLHMLRPVSSWYLSGPAAEHDEQLASPAAALYEPAGHATQLPS